MCGIVGMITNNPNVNVQDRKEVLKDLLLIDTLRGVHSTGVALLTKDDELHTMKRAMPAWDFLDLKASDTIFSKIFETVFFIGHNRAATRGKVNNKNSHPFIHDDIVGVHNGTLTFLSDLDDHKDFTVDSDLLYHNINKNGTVPTLEKVEGAFALVWIDHETSNLHVCRNDERPLYYAYTKGRNSIIYASEAGMINWVCDRRRIELDHEPVQFEVGKLYTFNKDNPTEFTTKDIKLKPKKTVYSGNSHYSHAYGTYYGGGRGNGGTNMGKGSARNNSGNGKGNKGNVKTGIPRNSRIEKSLKSLGFEPDVNYFSTVYEFDTYSQHNPDKWKAKGYMTALMHTPKSESVIIHGITMEEYIYQYADEDIKLKLCAVQSVKDGEVILIGDRQSLQKMTIDDDIREAEDEILYLGHDEVEGDESTVVGPGGKLIPSSTFRDMAKDGCVNCSTGIEPSEAENCMYVNNGLDVVCPDCSIELAEWTDKEEA